MTAVFGYVKAQSQMWREGGVAIATFDDAGNEIVGTVVQVDADVYTGVAPDHLDDRDVLEQHRQHFADWCDHQAAQLNAAQAWFRAMAVITSTLLSVMWLRQSVATDLIPTLTGLAAAWLIPLVIGASIRSTIRRLLRL